MPRLSNVKSGAIVSVPEEKVTRLGPDWIRIEVPEVGTTDSDPGKSPQEPAIDLEALTVAELHDEIARLNADRDPDDQIIPDGTKKADLVAALEAAAVEQ